MKYYSRRIEDEHGQAIIQVTIILAVLLGFLALAIDVGRVYSERRNLQNAADAGALAGARELCIGHKWEEAEAKARETMIENGVAEDAIRPDIDITPGGDPPNIVNVVARHPSMNPILGQLVDWGVIDVGATASAACGAAKSACGLWPVAFSKSIWKEIYDEAGEMSETRDIAIWNDDKEGSKKELKCTTLDGEISSNMCDCYACPDTKPKDGADDYLFVSTAGRGWLDFTSAIQPYADLCADSGGYGAAELKCQLKRDTAAQIPIPSCVAGASGNKAGVASTINARAGDILRIPLYDDDVPCEAGGPKGSRSYHISAVGCIQVVGWSNLQRDGDPKKLVQQTIYPPKTYPDITANSEKVIWAKALPDTACMTACGTTDGSQPIPGQLNAVNLIR